MRTVQLRTSLKTIDEQVVSADAAVPDEAWRRGQSRLSSKRYTAAARPNGQSTCLSYFV